MVRYEGLPVVSPEKGTMWAASWPVAGLSNDGKQQIAVSKED